MSRRPPPKPSPAQVRSARAISTLDTYRPDPRVCSVCSVQVDPDDLPCTVWAEHDEKDRPRAPPVLIFLGQGKDHEACRKAMADHPRLYVQEDGGPGSWPSLCGPCVHRTYLSCGHKDLKANGGTGLLVTLCGPDTMIVCTRSGCYTPVRPAIRCEGRVDGEQPKTWLHAPDLPLTPLETTQRLQENAAEREAIRMRVEELDRQSRELRELQSERFADSEEGLGMSRNENGTKERPYTRGGQPSAYTWCKCSGCGVVRRCTPQMDFYVRGMGNTVKDDLPLFCVACVDPAGGPVFVRPFARN